MSDDWFPTNGPLRQHELNALSFLDRNGPHQIGIIDSDEKFAAAYIFATLAKRGLALSVVDTPNVGGPTYRITPKGRSTLRSSDT